MANRSICRAAVIALATLFFASCAGDNDYSRAEFMLGTVISINTFGAASNELYDSLFERALEIERKMSISTDQYSDTELLRVAAAAGSDMPMVAASEETLDVAERALYYSALSNGAFDPTIAPVASIWAEALKQKTPPSDDAVLEALALVDWNAARIDRAAGALGLPTAGMGFDVGGIAKGFAADEAASLLLAAGVERALLDFGGNILLVGSKSDGTPWRIGVQHPRSGRGEYVAVVESDGDEAVVTSGDYERFFIFDGRRYHHLIDPATGYPVESETLSVVTITATSIDADALSTAFFVMGVEKGYRLAESLDGVEAIFVTDMNRLIATPGLRDRVVMVDPHFELQIGLDAASASR